MVALAAAGLEPWPLAIYATIGNVLGGLFNYGVGRLGKPEWIERYLHVKPESLAKAERFRRSPEGQGFDDPYGDGQDCFDFTTLAGVADIPKRIVTILKNYFDFTEHSHFVANTYADIHYFRKDPDDIPPKPMES